MRFLPLFLSSLLILNPLWAQTNSTGTANVGPAEAIHLNVVDDPGPALPHTTSAKGYVFQVTNMAGAPVSGAAVALRLPDVGPTGHFSGGLPAWVAYSDAAGIARFPLIQWGEGKGPVELHATVAKGTAHAGLVLAQNVGGVASTQVSVVSVPMNPSVPAPPLAPAKKETTVAVVAAKPTLPAAPPSMTSLVTAPVSKPLADVVPAVAAPVPPKSASKQTRPADAAKPTNDANGGVLPPDASVSKSTISLPDEAQVERPAAPPAPIVQLERAAPQSKALADAVPAASVSQSTTPAPGTPANLDVPRSSSGASEERAHVLTPNPPVSAKESESEPAISITNSPTGAGSGIGMSHKKLLILAAVGGGAALAAVVAVLAHSAGAGAGGGSSNSGVTVGAPTISVGH